jgi:hypothetical protein
MRTYIEFFLLMVLAGFLVRAGVDLIQAVMR